MCVYSIFETNEKCLSLLMFRLLIYSVYINYLTSRCKEHDKSVCFTLILCDHFPSINISVIS